MLTLPVAHSQLSLCQRLMASEINYLQQRLSVRSRLVQELLQSRNKELLMEGLTELDIWHLGAQGDVPSMARFLEGVEIHPQEEIPWMRLEPQARSALLAIVREALQNMRKHRQPGAIHLGLQVGTHDLELHVGSRSEPNLSPSSWRRSFGLESMRFRASLAGGRLIVDQDFSLTLRLPLLQAAP
ncbi:hypothetical protein IV102_25530 [bacterium]|nr:hypothetical protein [bacterium]